MNVRPLASCVALCLLLWLCPRSARAQSDVRAALAVARDAVVVVRCGDARVGSAFAWEGDRWVTTSHVADCPRDVSVEARDGRRVSARVVASDAEHDLAMLAVTGLAVRAPAVREDEVEIGEPIVAIGFLGGERGLVAHAGAVAQVTADALRTDAAYPGATGGPALDADGRVVGVMASAFDEAITYVVPVSWVARLADEAATDGDVRAPVRFRIGIDAGVLVLDQRALFAAEAHVSMDVWDQLTLRVALQTAGGHTTEWAPQPAERTESLIAGAATLGYRFRIQVDDAFALTITPEIGAWVGLRTATETQARLGFADPSCDPSSGLCGITTSTTSSTIEQTLVRPTLGVRVGLGDMVELGYQLQLDVEHPEASGHLATFGFRL